jgi:hypothetical protein
MKTKRILGTTVGLATVALLAAFSAQASITYTSTGSDSDGSLDGTAQFTFGAGYVTIVLDNLVTGSQLSQGQAVSGVTFNVAGVTSSSTFGQTFSGNAVDLVGNGTTTPVPADDSLPNWLVNPTAGNIELAVTGVIGSGGKPEDMIIPGGTTYVPGIDSHNPYALGSATFTLTSSLFTTSTTISDVDILFGTSPDAVLAAQPPTPPSVPEPTTVFAGAMLLLPFGIGAIRALRKDRQA